MTLEKQEINRIETAKAAIGTAIAGKGVAVPSGTKLDGMAALIDGIEQGSDPVLQSKTVSPTTSAQTVKPDSGYDALSQVTVNAMPTATQATPSISVSSGGLITASATQTAGYVAAGTKSATKQLTVQAAQTITPGTSNKTIASGRYLTGTQTIKGDANLKAANIAKGVSIFGVTGTHEGGEDVSAETAEYTSLLNNLETAIDALPDAGSGGGSGGSVEMCTVRGSDIEGICYYSDGTQVVEDGTSLYCGDTISVAKNSIIICIATRGTSVSGAIVYGDGELLLSTSSSFAFAVYGDCEIEVEGGAYEGPM
jgi:hypothetical protein